MTALCRASRFSIAQRRRGFTIVELLVVMGIIVLLASIVLVVASRVWKSADTTRLSAQLQTIEKGLDAYFTDFNAYPTTSIDNNLTTADNLINEAGFRGARILCKALIAPTPQGTVVGSLFDLNRASQDGMDGPGFRVPPRSGVFKFDTAANPIQVVGKSYGPYINGAAIGYGPLDPTGEEPCRVNTRASTFDDSAVLADANGNVILYYPVLNPQPTLKAPRGYIGEGPTTANPSYPVPMLRSTDNSNWISELDLRVKFGDVTSSGGSGPPDGAINNNANDRETAKFKGKYLLISPGRDSRFGINPNDASKTAAQKALDLDDVTNITE